jgi:4'-phosphopantetheinyl transferase
VPGVADVFVRWAVANAPPITETWLTAEERGRLHAFERPADQARFLASHALARLLVGARCEVKPGAVRLVQRCPRCGGPHGQPAVTLPDGMNIPPRISIAHAGSLVAVALSDDPVGVDLQRITAARHEAADVLLTFRERAELGLLPFREHTHALTRWLVRKEATLKATGHGFDLDPRELEVTSPALPPAVVWSSADLRGPIQLYDIELDDDGGYAMALALRSTQPPRLDLAPYAFS